MVHLEGAREALGKLGEAGAVRFADGVDAARTIASRLRRSTA
jgi:hypothetical protein